MLLSRSPPGELRLAPYVPRFGRNTSNTIMTVICCYCPHCCYYHVLQGMEKDIIILATTITHNGAFASDVQRVNVALTRARHHLLVLGCSSVLRSCSAAFRLLLASCPSMPAAGSLPIRSASPTAGHDQFPSSTMGVPGLEPSLSTAGQPIRSASHTNRHLQSAVGVPGLETNLLTEGQPARSTLHTTGGLQPSPPTESVPVLEPLPSSTQQPVRSPTQPAVGLQDAQGNISR